MIFALYFWRFRHGEPFGEPGVATILMIHAASGPVFAIFPFWVYPSWPIAIALGYGAAACFLVGALVKRRWGMA